MEKKIQAQRPASLALSYVLPFTPRVSPVDDSDVEEVNPTHASNNLRPPPDNSDINFRGFKPSRTRRLSIDFMMRYGSKYNNEPAMTFNEKPFACPVPGCKKRYKNANGIKYHSKHGHKKGDEDPKRYKCHCGKSYTIARGLKLHALAVHKSSPTSEELEEASTENSGDNNDVTYVGTSSAIKSLSHSTRNIIHKPRRASIACFTSFASNANNYQAGRNSIQNYNGRNNNVVQQSSDSVGGCLSSTSANGGDLPLYQHQQQHQPQFSVAANNISNRNTPQQWQQSVVNVGGASPAARPLTAASEVCPTDFWKDQQHFSGGTPTAAVTSSEPIVATVGASTTQLHIESQMGQQMNALESLADTYFTSSNILSAPIVSEVAASYSDLDVSSQMDVQMNAPAPLATTYYQNTGISSASNTQLHLNSEIDPLMNAPDSLEDTHYINTSAPRADSIATSIFSEMDLQITEFESVATTYYTNTNMSTSPIINAFDTSTSDLDFNSQLDQQMNSPEPLTTSYYQNTNISSTFIEHNDSINTNISQMNVLSGESLLEELMESVENNDASGTGNGGFDVGTDCSDLMNNSIDTDILDGAINFASDNYYGSGSSDVSLAAELDYTFDENFELSSDSQLFD